MTALEATLVLLLAGSSVTSAVLVHAVRRSRRRRREVVAERDREHQARCVLARVVSTQARATAELVKVIADINHVTDAEQLTMWKEIAQRQLNETQATVDAAERDLRWARTELGINLAEPAAPQ